MSAWQKMAQDTTHRASLLLYTRDPVPSEDERPSNPYSSFVALGARFPEGAGHSFQALCYDFLPARRTDIELLFADGGCPDLSHLDSLSEGGVYSHPRLEAIFGSSEPTSIIQGFLVPSNQVIEQLDASHEWIPELTGLMDRLFGYRLSAKISKASTLRDKLWQFLLFSEFANDLPGELPSDLREVPHATGSAGAVITNVCQRLRTTDGTKETYRERAIDVESELDLARECESITDLGECDTFPFEEKRFLRFAATCVGGGDLTQAQQVLDSHRRSLWAEEGERHLLWLILGLSLETLDAILHAEEDLKNLGPHGCDLVDLYATKLCQVDRKQRELDSACRQLDDGLDEIEAVIDIVHSRYQGFVNLLLEKLHPTVTREGWPLAEVPCGVDTYRDAVAPLLKDGKRVAYILADALRLELAQQLGDSVGQRHDNEVIPVCIQLPGVTRYAMASLTPNAGEDLQFEVRGEYLEPVLGSTPVGAREARLASFEKHLGSQVETFKLSDFVDQTKTPARRKGLAEKLSNIDLIVITSVEIDSTGEGDASLQPYIAEPLDKIQRAIGRSAELGFDVAVVATDHGFLWIDGPDAGLTVGKPNSGEWVLEKRRCYLGKGDAPAGSIRFDSAALSIPSEAPTFITPQTVGRYRGRTGYTHEGLSLQEAVVGRMIVQLKGSGSELPAPEAADLELTRKRSKASSRIVSMTLSWPDDATLFQDSEQFQVTAVQGQQEIGVPTASEYVDGATGRVALKPGQSIKLSIRLGEKAQPGKFKVKVIDIKTDKTKASLDLEYDPTVL